MKLIATTATAVLVFCMSCSTAGPVPEPGPSHPASPSPSVPAVAGPSDLLRGHDPLPQLSTRQAPDGATEHDHDATDPDPDAIEAAPPGHQPGQHEPATGEMDSASPDAQHPHDTEAEPIVYACPMHPDQQSAKPADCPICGMKMEPVEVEP